MHKITLALHDVTKRYRDRPLFAPLSCQVVSGECLVITGINGSGKTTLIKMIAHLIKPSYGSIQITVDGRILKDAEQILPYLGLVSPEIVMYDQLTGIENIALLSQARGLLLKRKQITEVLSALGLNKHGEQYVKTYSTGMKQRLKFALLAAIDPPVWLIDEGLSNLDAPGKELVLALLRQGLAEDHLMVLTTNEGTEVAYATKTISLS